MYEQKKKEKKKTNAKIEKRIPAIKKQKPEVKEMKQQQQPMNPQQRQMEEQKKQMEKMIVSEKAKKESCRHCKCKEATIVTLTYVDCPNCKLQQQYEMTQQQLDMMESNIDAMNSRKKEIRRRVEDVGCEIKPDLNDEMDEEEE